MPYVKRNAPPIAAAADSASANQRIEITEHARCLVIEIMKLDLSYRQPATPMERKGQADRLKRISKTALSIMGRNFDNDRQMLFLFYQKTALGTSIYGSMGYNAQKILKGAEIAYRIILDKRPTLERIAALAGSLRQSTITGGELAHDDPTERQVVELAVAGAELREAERRASAELVSHRIIPYRL